MLVFNFKLMSISYLEEMSSFKIIPKYRDRGGREQQILPYLLHLALTIIHV